MKTYDEEQRRAIEAASGYYLVLAPPGCGKTDILSERIANAHDAGVEYEDMLCLTFTNRASRGMLSRVVDRVGNDAQSIFVGNVHRFCSNFLFSNAVIPENTCIIDADDLVDILQTQNGEFFKNGRGTIDRYKVNEVNNIASYIAQRRLEQPREAIFLPEEYEEYYLLAKTCGFEEWKVPQGNELLRYALFYTEYKRQRGYIDFNDILILAYEALRKDTQRLYRRYPWIQVDEVQDLNALQMAIVDELTDDGSPFTVMYLGDEQQAIFSFLGAKLEQLSMLKTRCAGHILHLGKNYRSPSYLLDVFNTYAENELHVDPTLLPQPTHETKHDKWDLILAHSRSSLEQDNRIPRMVNYYMQFDGERLAILVPTNAAADRISEELTLRKIPNFKISGRDMFDSKSYKTLSSFFCCVTNEFNAMAWVRLLYGIGAFHSQADARAFVAKTKELMMTPMDLLPERSRIDQFCSLYENSEMVYFDTETTGLNVEEDDIVQIAAFKVRGGEKVAGSDFIIFMHTDREIPAKLGELDNPLIKAYANNPHYSRQEGLAMFLDYIGEDAVLGHNVMYDYRILQCNVRKYLHKEVTLDVYDSLRLAKCVEPNLLRYKLEYLIEELHLEGKNSHLADEDVDATKKLVDYCYDKARHVIPQQRQYTSQVKVQNVRQRLMKLVPLFERFCSDAYKSTATLGRTLADEIRDVYDSMLSMQMITPLGSKFDIFLKYVESEWADTETNLMEQIHAHINDMTSSISEGDLINSTELVHDRVFIMTVHKGKGLEFDNVVVLEANDGTYPFYTVNRTLESHGSTSEQKAKAMKERMEDARKFYVAISRAKKRLCVSYTDSNSYGMPTRMTPFMRSIAKYFYTGRN